MKKFICSTLIFSACSLFAEVSVFGAGDLDSSQPYGLNKTEKHIVQNKKQLSSIDTKVKTVQSQIDLVNQRIDGLESLYEGDSQKLNDTVRRLNKALKAFEQDAQTSQQNSQNIDNIKQTLTKLISLQEDNYQTQKKNLTILRKEFEKLANVVNNINKNFVQKSDLQNNLGNFLTIKDFKKFKKELAKDLGGTSNSVSKVDKTQSNKEIYEEAVAMFDKNWLTKSIPKWEHLIDANYRPAESNYRLGEIWYYKDDYEKAISYFKTSTMLYDKGWWMPNLLLHSAIAFEKRGDIDNAVQFYDTLISMYPDSQQAQEAKKNLQ